MFPLLLPGNGELEEDEGDEYNQVFHNGIIKYEIDILFFRTPKSTALELFSLASKRL